MFAYRLLAIAALALANIGVVLAAPAPTSTIDPSCPVTYTSVITQTLSIIAPTTTGPFETTTFTAQEVSYPVVTTTITDTYTFSGTVWAGSPTYTVTTTDYTTTYTETEVYTNYYGEPPFPSDCYQ